MRSTLQKSFVLLLFLGLVLPDLSAQNHKKTFEAKKHRDTILNKSSLKARETRGKTSSENILLSNPYNFGQKPASLSGTLKKADLSGSTKTVYSQETGLPIFITSPLTTSSGARKAVSADKKVACFNYMNEISSITKIAKPEEEFVVKNITTEEDGKSHIRLNQRYKGVNIYGAEVIIHLTSGNVGEAFNGKYHTIKNEIDVKPSITAEQAIQNTVADLLAKSSYRELTEAEKKLMQYEAPEVETIIYQESKLVKAYLLTYHITIMPNLTEVWEYFINAKTGKVIDSYKQSCHVDGPATTTATDLNGTSRTIHTYLQGSSYVMADVTKPMYNSSTETGAIVTYDANYTYGSGLSVNIISTSNNTGWSSKAVSAHYNAGIAYDYYKNAHNRNSIDGKGGDIISIINVNDANGAPMDNAYWNGKAMFYGNGDVAFKPLAGGLDVAGHEMTHGVVQSTAGLEYKGESGAINESMADIFGSTMDSTNWTIGEQVIPANSPYYSTGALRDLSDPHNGGTSFSDNGYQPEMVSEMYTGTQDNGGVHINSGIPNHAYYLLATALGSRLKTTKIFYRALTTYLTKTSQFIDLRLAVIKAAGDLHGASSNEVTQAGLAFDAVGIVDGSGSGSTGNDLPINPGSGYLLVYDTDINNDGGLYRSTPSATNFVGLLDKNLYNKPSVMDNGNVAVFVGLDKKIYSIVVSPAMAQDSGVVDDSPFWANAAISKDGNRLAAVSYDEDTSIYVYDFVSDTWNRFILYAPTYTEGEKAVGPVFADALEWDYTGEYLIYDCYNNIKNNSSGDDIEYFDINLIKVWDNLSGNFGNGTIYKLFDNLEPGENIGNPTFSKNSPNKIAFDYFDGASGTYAVFGYDLEHNEIGAIAINTTLGWPSYNRKDEVLALTYEDAGANLDINYVKLNSDKISSNGTMYKLTDNAMWPVYYAVGTRDLPTATIGAIDNNPNVKLYPNPVKDELNISFLQGATTATKLEIFNQLGQPVFSQTTKEGMDGDLLRLKVTDLKEGIYFVKIGGDKYNQTLRFVKVD